MAEIRVEKKSYGGWLLLAGVLLAAIVAWAILARSANDEPEMSVVAPVGGATAPSPGVATDSTGAGMLPAVSAFASFATGAPEPAAGEAHEYTAEGIRRLTAALSAMIDQPSLAGSPVRGQFEEFRQQADRIQQEPDSPQHANAVRAAFTSAAGLMAALQRDRWPDATDMRARVDEVTTAAAALDTGKPLLEQRAAVKAFFDRAAAALQAMPEPSRG